MEHSAPEHAEQSRHRFVWRGVDVVPAVSACEAGVDCDGDRLRSGARDGRRAFCERRVFVSGGELRCRVADQPVMQGRSDGERMTPELRRYRWVIIFFAVCVVVLSFIPIRNNLRADHKDYPLWYRTGKTVLDGGDLYPANQAFPFIYPPPAAVMLAPFCAWGKMPLVIVLVLVITASWGVATLSSVYLATGSMWRQHPLLYLMPSLCCITYIDSMYLLGQPNLTLAACLLAAFVCLRQGRHWATGALVALAAAIKAFPVLALIYLVYRRHWKAAGWTVAFLVFFFVLMPAPFRGFHRNLDELHTWATKMAFNYQPDSFAQRTARAYSYKNQSLMSVANRLLRPVSILESNDPPLTTINVANLSFNQVNAIAAVIALGACLFFVTSMPANARRTLQTDAIEIAMLLLLILIVTPLFYQYGCVWLMFPFALLTQYALEAPPSSRQRRSAVIWLVATLVLLALAVPWRFSLQSQALGNILAATFVLLIGLGLRLRRLRRVC